MACRMFGYCGNSESDVHELYSGLKQACANDPMLDAVAPGCSAHCHGWGYVINADNGLFHYRTAKSIYEDKIVLPKLEGKIRAIFHGRYASKPELAGHIFAHPFMAADDQRVTFFAHSAKIRPTMNVQGYDDAEIHFASLLTAKCKRIEQEMQGYARVFDFFDISRAAGAITALSG